MRKWVPFSCTPVVSGRRPVMNEARLGLHSGYWQYARSNRKPRRGQPVDVRRLHQRVPVAAQVVVQVVHGDEQHVELFPVRRNRPRHRDASQGPHKTEARTQDRRSPSHDRNASFDGVGGNRPTPATPADLALVCDEAPSYEAVARCPVSREPPRDLGDADQWVLLPHQDERLGRRPPGSRKPLSDILPASHRRPPCRRQRLARFFVSGPDMVLPHEPADAFWFLERGRPGRNAGSAGTAALREKENRNASAGSCVRKLLILKEKRRFFGSNPRVLRVMLTVRGSALRGGRSDTLLTRSRRAETRGRGLESRHDHASKVRSIFLLVARHVDDDRRGEDQDVVLPLGDLHAIGIGP